MPLIMAFAFTEMAVQHSNFNPLRGKAGGKALDCLRSEGNFRNEHKRGLARIDHLADGAQINLGLAATCDALEHDGLVFVRLAQSGTDSLQGFFLFGTQRRRLGRNKLLRAARRATHRFRSDFDQSTPG